MGKEDKMIQAQKDESALKVNYVKQIVDQMEQEEIAITPYSVWKKSGLSKGFIYNNEEVKQYIDEHRSEKKYNFRTFDQKDVYEIKINELEKENAYLRKMLRYSQSENLERLYFENKVMKKQLEKYEELVAQGIIHAPAIDLELGGNKND